MTGPAPIPHLAQRAAALEPLGWRGRDAEWLTLVCLHSGIFTRAQYSYRFDVERYAAHRFVYRLVSAGLARERPHPDLPTTTRLCHISGRGLYRALGVEHIRHRRFGSDGVVFRRLLSLDYVLERPELPWLATEHEKLAHFEGLGIKPATLPQRVYSGAVGKARRYFYLKLPLAADDREALFVYADPGLETTSQLHHWGAMHDALWTQLRALGIAVHVAVATRSAAAQVAYDVALAKWLPASESEALHEDERELLDTILAAIDDGDDELLAQWGGLTAAGIRAAPLYRRGKAANGACGRIDSFETHLALRVASDAFAT